MPGIFQTVNIMKDKKKKNFFFKGMGRTILEKKTKKLNSQIQREVLDWIMDKQNHQC